MNSFSLFCKLHPLPVDIVDQRFGSHDCSIAGGAELPCASRPWTTKVLVSPSFGVAVHQANESVLAAQHVQQSQCWRRYRTDALLFRSSGNLHARLKDITDAYSAGLPVAQASRPTVTISVN